MLTNFFYQLSAYRQKLVTIILLMLLVFSLGFSSMSVLAEDGGGGAQVCVGCP